MNPKIVALGIIAMIAAVGAVTTLTATSFIQEAEANACNLNTKVGKASGSCIQGKFGTDPADDNFHNHDT